MYIPASVVVAVMVLLTGPLPAALIAVTLILYLLSSSSPAIVKVEKAPETKAEPLSVPGQPTEVSLCHFTVTPVTTDPLGTLPLMVIVVEVTIGDVSRTGVGNGTRGREKSPVLANSHNST